MAGTASTCPAENRFLVQLADSRLPLFPDASTRVGPITVPVLTESAFSVLTTPRSDTTPITHLKPQFPVLAWISIVRVQSLCQAAPRNDHRPRTDLSPPVNNPIQLASQTSPLTAMATATVAGGEEAFNHGLHASMKDMTDPFVDDGQARRASQAHRYSSLLDPESMTLGASTSPSQVKRSLLAHLAETDRRLHDAQKLGESLLLQQSELNDKLREVEETARGCRDNTRTTTEAGGLGKGTQ